MDVKYNSNDAVQVDKQMADIRARGFDGVELDWYSQFNTSQDQTAQLIRDNLDGKCLSPQNCPLEYLLVYDQGAVTRTEGTRAACTGSVSAMQACILADLCYANATYFGTPGYVKVNPTTHAWATSTNPEVGFFPPSDTSLWNTAVSNLKAITANNGWAASMCPSGEQQANGGLVFVDKDTTNVASSPYSGGGSWVGTSAWPNQFLIDGPTGTYHEDLYSSCSSNTSSFCEGSGKKGFDDNIGNFGSNRVIAQECGQTWVQTLGKASHFTGSNLELHVPTWNDYDEGSEIETGIDNCYRINAPTLVSSTVSWTMSTNDSTYAPLSGNGTIDHFAVWACDLNDKNCSLAGTTTPSTLSLNVSSLPSGSYHIWVQMVGVNSILNRMSPSAVTFTH